MQLSLKAFLFSFFSLSLTLNLAFAETFIVEKTDVVNKRAEDVKDILLDYENTCDSGCKFKLTSVKEMKIVEKVDDNNLFMWCHVDNVKDSYTFAAIKVTNNDQGKIVVSSTFPIREKIKQLTEQTKLSHRTMMDSLETTWTMEEKFDKDGKFVNTEVTYRAKMLSDSMVIKMFSGTVRKSMKETAEDMFDNIR